MIRSANDIPQIWLNMEYAEMSDGTDEAMAWLSGKTFGPFIDGKWLVTKNEEDAKPIAVKSPNTGEILAIVSDSSLQDVDSALQFSVDVNSTWRKLNGCDRNKYLYRISTQLKQNSQLISQLSAISMGVKPKHVSDWDVSRAANVFMYYAGWAQLMEEVETRNGAAAIVTCAACPLAGIAWLVAPILAAGGTVCLKPSHRHPLLVFLFADICGKAGLPAGVINVLPGPSEVGDYLIRSSQVKHVCFFGATSVGQTISRNVSGSSKTLAMLVDAKSTMIVFDSADIESAATEFVKAAWFYQGQLPWSVKCLLVQESIFTEVVKKLETRVSNLCTGSSLDKLTDIGPAVKKNVHEEVSQMLSRAESKGVQIIQAKGSRGTSDCLVFTPAILIGAGADVNTVLNDYSSAPVITVIPFRTAKESTVLANNSLNGLAVSIWTENLTLAFDVAKKLEVGTVWLNSHGVFDAAVPFAARKKSGHGSFCGKEGFLQHMTVQKTEQNVNEIKMGKIICGCASRDGVADVKYKLYYGGDFRTNDSGNFSYTICNAKREVFAILASGNRNDVCHAVNASLNAKNIWEQKSFHQRTEILHKLADLVHSRTNDIIRKTNLSELQVSWCAGRLAYWASICGKQQLTSCTCIGDSHVMSHKEPLGIVAALIPHSDQKLAVDILASTICFGNVIVIASCSVLLLELCALLQASGVPAGVVAVLSGDGVVTPLIQHQAVDAIWFRKENEELGQLAATVSACDLKRMWDIPSTISQEAWEFNSTVTKTIWVPAVGACSN